MWPRRLDEIRHGAGVGGDAGDGGDVSAGTQARVTVDGTGECHA
ncbi:MAG: hypothetical protein ACK5VE_06520 [Alphaproteobacteria bacterium]